jgi:DNA-binding NarL/FixJ family response regulator
MSVRLVLVDDHQAFRARLRALLQRDPTLDIVAELSSAQELFDILQTADVQVVCMDIRLPGISGIEATRRLRAMNPAIRVIGLSAYAEPHYVEAMLDAGAVGHFTKGDAGERLLHAIHHATATHPLFGPNIVGPPVADATTALATPAAVDGAPPDAIMASLGAREMDVLRLITHGLEPAQIADSLAIDPTLVEVYRRNIMRKLNLHSDDALRDCARSWSLRRGDDNPSH